MSIKATIPDVQGLQDPKAADILKAVKLTVDSITGRAAQKPAIKTLGPTATTAGIINKLNELIVRLQG